MPVEFSVVAYCFGHSVVRPRYRLNDDLLFRIVSPDRPDSLTGFQAIETEVRWYWKNDEDADIR